MQKGKKQLIVLELPAKTIIFANGKLEFKILTKYCLTL